MDCCFSIPPIAFSILLIGLDNAGKTTIMNNLVSQHVAVSGTWGFTEKKLRHRNNDITLFDVGGGASIRGYWKKYYHDVAGFVFVIDSADGKRMKEVAEVMKELAENDYVKGKPILIFANKQDLTAAFAPHELAHEIEIDKLEGNFHIVLCSALYEAKDSRLLQGMDWIVGKIEDDWEAIKQRISKDKEYQDKLYADEIAATVARAKARKLAENSDQGENIVSSKSGTIESDRTGVSVDLAINAPEGISEKFGVALLQSPSIDLTAVEYHSAHPNALPATPVKETAHR